LSSAYIILSDFTHYPHLFFRKTQVLCDLRKFVISQAAGQQTKAKTGGSIAGLPGSPEFGD
jgi:hypothetical protein